MFTLQITKAAERDIEDTIDWYNKRKADLGYEFLNEVHSHLLILVSNPQLFPVKYFPYHEFPLKRFPYIVTYIILKRKVIIKSVMAAKKHPAKKYRK